MHLIIAEDDPTTRKTLHRAAQAMGHEVTSVSTGAALVEAFRQRRADAILTDWEMPEVDGPNAVRQVRSLDAGGTPFVVLLTGEHDVEGVAAALESGCDDYLLKPLDLRRFRVVLRIAEIRSVARQSRT